MHKFLALILTSAFLLCALCGCEHDSTNELGTELGSVICPTLPENNTVDSSTAYAPILARFYDIISAPDAQVSFSDGEFGVVTAASVLGDAALNTIGYVLKDLNGDEVDELLIGVFDKPEGSPVANELYAGYTLDGNVPVLLFEGNQKNSFSLKNDNTLYYYGSAGAMYIIFGSYALNSSGELSCTEYYFSHEKDGDASSLGFYHNTSGVWDTSLSVELDTDLDAFLALQRELSRGTAKLSYTKFSELK